LRCLELIKQKDQNWNLDFPTFDTIKNKVNVLVNLALCYQKLNKESQALDYIQQALKLAPGNSKIITLQTKLMAQASPSKPKLDNKKIIDNHPNAESLNSHHSRKSSMLEA
jgi:tetratricopeptide (TPR) repeat protein